MVWHGGHQWVWEQLHQAQSRPWIFLEAAQYSLPLVKPQLCIKRQKYEQVLDFRIVETTTTSTNLQNTDCA